MTELLGERITALRRAKELNQKQLAETWTYERKPGVTLGQLVRPKG